MADLPSELRTLVERYGAHVLDDADGLRATLNDFLDEDSSPGDVNLLVDAVRFGSLERLRTLLGQGADPAAALADVAEGLAQRRGGDAESAHWACACLGYAASLLSADLIPGTWERPSSLLPPRVADGTPPAEGSDVTYVVGQSAAAPLSDPNVTRHPGGQPAPPDPVIDAAQKSETAGLTSPVSGEPSPTIDSPEPTPPGSTKSRGKLVGIAAVVALIIAGAVAFALTRSNSDGKAAASSAGGAVSISTVTQHDLFGHFGDNLSTALTPTCSNVAPPGADHDEFACPFAKFSDFYILFNNGDPLTTNANEQLPAKVLDPTPNTIVTVQQAGADSFHAYWMKHLSNGKDGLRDTGDDTVDFVLYDVAKEHPGSATFTARNPNSDPLTQEKANELLLSIGIDASQFPLPKPFAKYSGLKNFAEKSLTDEQLRSCTEAFTTIRGEYEHVTCRDSGVTIGFGVSKNLSLVANKYHGDHAVWSDKAESGQLITSNFSGSSRLLWYPDNPLSYQYWGLLSAKTNDHTVSDLRKMFEGFANHPTITSGG